MLSARVNIDLRLINTITTAATISKYVSYGLASGQIGFINWK